MVQAVHSEGLSTGRSVEIVDFRDNGLRGLPPGRAGSWAVGSWAVGSWAVGSWAVGFRAVGFRAVGGALARWVRERRAVGFRAVGGRLAGGRLPAARGLARGFVRNG